jgi:molybdenum cofactor cytidylyltransferase
MIVERARPGARGSHWVIVLAAGGSRRLGRAKQLVRFGPETLVAAAARRALATAPAGVVVVTGAGSARVAAALRTLPVTVVRNRHWRDGMAASLHAGLARIPTHAPRLLVTTVDQWALAPADLLALLNAARGGRTAAACYAGTRGIPAVFPRSARALLLSARGDRGARAFLQGPDVRAVRMPHAELDLDTPADLARLRASRARHSRGGAGTR